ncbi:PTS fructose transporter subunit IIC, partial [Streptococcus suis]
FLGALVGGFLAGGVELVLRNALRNLPKSLQGLNAILLLQLLGTAITGFLMFFVNITMAAINTGMNNFLAALEGSSDILLA